MSINPENILHSRENNKQNGSITKMTMKDFLMIIVLNLALPSLDVHSDLVQMCVFAAGLYNPYQRVIIQENSKAEMDGGMLRNLTSPDMGTFNESAFAVQYVKLNDTHIKTTHICESIVSPWFTLLTSGPYFLHIYFLPFSTREN